MHFAADFDFDLPNNSPLSSFETILLLALEVQAIFRGPWPFSSLLLAIFQLWPVLLASRLLAVFLVLEVFPLWAVSLALVALVALVASQPLLFAVFHQIW